MSDEQVRRSLLEYWYEQHCYGKESKARSMKDEQLLEALDVSGACLLHRLRLYDTAEDLGGLHVVGTERHESRRIDNQLRGRSGRQGDRGSSRFFLSLEDPLMKMFAGPTTLKLLSRLGMKEGDAIEHPMLSKAVGRAQRKVEERNFLIRKNILEYDEVMDHQRHEFYGTRQRILEGRDIKELIFDHLQQASADAAWRFMDPRYPSTCIAEWVREHMSVNVEASRLKTDDREDLHDGIHRMAHAEATSILRVSIGEFLSEDIDLGEGAIARRDEGGDDYQGLADWMNGHFGTSLGASDMVGMERRDLLDHLDLAAAEAIEKVDLGPLDAFLLEDYPKRELAQWASTRFGIEFEIDRLLETHDAEEATAVIIETAAALYREREICYPIDFAIDMTNASMEQDPAEAISQFCRWANARYELDWSADSLPATDPREIRTLLIEAARTWDDDKIADRAGRILAEHGEDVDAIDAWARSTMNATLSVDERKQFAEDPRGLLIAWIKRVMRVEVSQLEQWILLQILDSSWKEHLHQMDQLRESIGYRSFSQRDPKIEFKREGSSLFEEMLESIRDKVTDLVFKARLQARPRQVAPSQTQPKPAAPQPPSPEDPQQIQDRTAVAAAAAAASEGRRVRTGGGQRMPSPAAASSAVVGRNEPCPCGSGKKYKKCCGSRGSGVGSR